MPSSCKQHNVSLVVDDVAVQRGLGAFCWATEPITFHGSLCLVQPGLGVGHLICEKFQGGGEGEQWNPQTGAEQRDSLATRCANSLGTPDFRKTRINAEESQRTFEVTGVFEEYLPAP